jgi:hypothetical protein
MYQQVMKVKRGREKSNENVIDGGRKKRKERNK